MGWDKLLFGLLLCAIGLPLHAQPEIFKVANVDAGNSLNLRAWPSVQSRVKVAMPHNASWVVKLPKVKKVGSSNWRLIRWNQVEGWVNEHYLSKDDRASWLLKKRGFCMKDNKVTNKTCCGFPVSLTKQTFQPVKAYSVQSVDEGSSLPMQSAPGKGSAVVAIPHDARWLTYLGQERNLQNGQGWMYTRWNGQNGWVNKDFLRYDATQTQRINLKRRQCMQP